MNVKKMLGKVSYKANLAGDTWLLGIDLAEVVEFLPGQFISLKVNDGGLRRSYSIASFPGKRSIDLVVDVSPMGVGSKYVLGLKVSDSVEVLGFLGKFIVSDEMMLQKEMIFVGTGTGIAPLKPMVEDLLVNKGFRGQVRLVWGMRYESDLFWISEIDKLHRNYDNFHFEIILSKPGSDWSGRRGHVGDVVDSLSYEWKKTGAFLCGNPEMITEIKGKLLSKGVPEDRINFERFA